MNRDSVIVFVCEHGAAKSILAATYFNQLATKLEVNFRALARGTNPDPVVSPQMLSGLADDGLTPIEFTPRKLTDTDIQSSRRVVSFCELPAKFLQAPNIEYWKDIPPVSKSYGRAREAVIVHIRQLLASLG